MISNETSHHISIRKGTNPNQIQFGLNAVLITGNGSNAVRIQIISDVQSIITMRICSFVFFSVLVILNSFHGITWPIETEFVARVHDGSDLRNQNLMSWFRKEKNNAHWSSNCGCTFRQCADARWCQPSCLPNEMSQPILVYILRVSGQPIYRYLYWFVLVRLLCPFGLLHLKLLKPYHTYIICCSIRMVS